MAKLPKSVINNLSTAALTTSNIGSTISNSYYTRLPMSTPLFVGEFKAGENEIYIKTDKNGIYSNIINGQNALIMLQTMKKLLITKGIFTEEEFNEEYAQIESDLQAYEEALKVLEKLSEEQPVPSDHTNWYEPFTFDSTPLDQDQWEQIYSSSLYQPMPVSSINTSITQNLIRDNKGTIKLPRA